MNNKLRKETKNDFKKDFFCLMNNSAFVKTMENVRNHRDVNLVITEINQSQNQITIQQNVFQKICQRK